MKKKLTLTIFCYIFTLNSFPQSQLIIGDNTNFENFYLENVNIIKGDRDKNYLQIEQNEYKSTPDTDFLIHFNDQKFIDEAGNYSISYHYNNISDVEKKLGSSSAFFLKNKKLVFNSNGDSLFSPGRILGDFTIEFWLYPTMITEDTIMFSWKGVNKVDAEFIPQKIKCYFEERQAIWEFENLFVPVDFSNNSIKLRSKSKVIPKMWNHYLLRYRSDLGMIEFLINGIPEDIKYTTETEKEDMVVYTPYVGNFSKSDIYIGEKLRGFIDEFRISEKFIKKPELSKFQKNGFFYSPVYDINGDSIILEKFNIKDNIIPETEISYKYRISDYPFLSENSNLEWIPIKETTENIRGRYIQVMGNLYSNGKRDLSPIIESIEINWREIPKPPPPQFLSSVSKKNALEIIWSDVKHYNIDGYYLYIGNESNNYIEMIDVGKNTSYTIENLIYKNIYYFSVRSYKDNKKSNYSIEKFNRPE